MKTLILYYSYGGNTKKIAEQIQASIEADIAEIKTVEPYVGSYDDVVDLGKIQIDEGYMPEIKPLEIDFDEYDKILLGTPVWWYTYAPAIKTCLKQYDFTNKTVYPFITNGGWIGHTEKDIINNCKNAFVMKAINIKFDGASLAISKQEINNWIHSIL